MQVNCEAEPLGPENPHAIGFCTKEVELTHELAAIRNVNTETSRIWKIKNESVRNRLTGTTQTPSHPPLDPAALLPFRLPLGMLVSSGVACLSGSGSLVGNGCSKLAI